ncbi:hypothetical protein E3T55_13485 [Cryobacterium frigoriphilum]|uniref:Ig-like domain repeat protein n=1 Tax=Cryobacterium frigoriphilum TaxID=1259150 RepID=A0A4R8ZXE6_9MICO|nr:Ig-like domain repeat protein [Cryobacterium frigoriphilum]TFD48288.1 hypothetical protein E3T55_13485 [Cryobacterium frigoriphilum]
MSSVVRSLLRPRFTSARFTPSRFTPARFTPARFTTARLTPTAALVAALMVVSGAFTSAAVAAGTGGEVSDLAAPASVVGSGPTGSVSVPVTPGVTGPVSLSLSGLTAGARVPNPGDAASAVTGRAATGDAFSYRVEVPAGSRFVRFDLDSIGDGADLDLNIVLDRPGEESVMWDAQSDASDEHVDIPGAPGGSYLIAVTAYSGASDFTLTSFAVPSGSGAGTFTATPSTLAGEAAVTANVGLSWAGLQAGAAYLGVIEYGATGVSTVVTVGAGSGGSASSGGSAGSGSPDGAGGSGAPTDPGSPDEPGAPPLANAMNSAPPNIGGTPEVGRTLRARAGEWQPAGLDFAYRWRADGVDIAGATGSRYRVTDAVAGRVVTLVVTATADGFSPALAVSSGVRVKAVSKVTLTLNRSAASVDRTIIARIRVVSTKPGEADVPQTGAVIVTVGGRDFTVQLGRGGRARFTLPDLKSGTHRVSASWAGTATVAGDTSPTVGVRLRLG